MEWDPCILDSTTSNDEKWFDAVCNLSKHLISSPFDEFGNYRYREADLHYFDAGEIPTVEDDISVFNVDDEVHNAILSVNEHANQSKSSEGNKNFANFIPSKSPTVSKKKALDYEALRPFFLHTTADVVKRTFEATTQYARTNIGGLQLKKTFKTPFPACNIHRRNEAVATDTIYSDTPAIDDGSKIAQLYVGRDTLVTDVFGIKTEKQFVNTLEDNIRKRGAMDKLISDRAQVEISGRVLDILRSYVIDSWQSEPHYQHQNFAERRYSTVKPLVNVLLNLTGAPAYCWLLALVYVCFVLNYTATKSLNWRTPIEKLTGSTPDISSLLYFQF